MVNKRTMTLNLTDKEMSALEILCGKKNMNKTDIIRQALRLYQTIDTRIERGERLYFENDLTQSKAELVIL